MKPWRRLEQTRVTQAGFRTVVHKQFEMNNGTIMHADVDAEEGMQGVCVIAVTPDKQVVIARQFRCGPEQILDELPGGLVDDGETPEQAGKRELLEEVGYAAAQFEYIGWIYVNPWHNGIHHYYLAYDCDPVAANNPEEFEEIEVVKISIDQLINNARTGNMTDAAGVLLAYDRLIELEGK